RADLGERQRRRRGRLSEVSGLWQGGRGEDGAAIGRRQREGNRADIAGSLTGQGSRVTQSDGGARGGRAGRGRRRQRRLHFGDDYLLAAAGEVADRVVAGVACEADDPVIGAVLGGGEAGRCHWVVAVGGLGTGEEHVVDGVFQLEGDVASFVEAAG